MYEEAKSVMNSAAENCPDVGQICYYMAQLAKAVGNNEDYSAFLNLALENRNTLNIDVDKIMAEIENIN